MENQDLFYLTDTMASLAGIPVRIYQGKEKIHYSSMLSFPVDPVIGEEEKVFSLKDKVGYFYTEDFYYYVYVKSKEKTIVLGPSRFRKQNKQEQRDIAFRLGLDEEDTISFCSALDQLMPFPMESLLQVALALNLVLNGERKSLTEFLLPSLPKEKEEVNESPKTGEDQQENYGHNTLNIEKKLLFYVSHGDKEGWNVFLQSMPAIRPGLLSDNALRERKNLFIVIATLVSRAAIEGGLDSEDAFTLSDLYIQRSELVHEIYEINSLIFRMISDYTERVASLKTVSSSPLVQQVYTYVQKHISEDCSIDEIAAAVFLSRSRLCTKFREESGKTVKDFVMEQKIAEAKKLLVVTTHPLSQISTYLGFSSQSYFNAVFRKAVGLSPRAYREKNTGSEEAH